MIFEHPFCDNFRSHTHIIFYFLSQLFWFSYKYLLFFINYGCHLSVNQIGYSNNTPLISQSQIAVSILQHQMYTLRSLLKSTRVKSISFSNLLKFKSSQLKTDITLILAKRVHSGKLFSF